MPKFGAAGGIKLLLADAGVDFQEIKYNYDSWLPVKENLLKIGASPAGTLPLLQIGDKYYSQTAAIIVYLTKVLDYSPNLTADENYRLWAAMDLARDGAMAKYRKDKEAWLKNIGALEKFLTAYHSSISGEGAFVLKDKVSAVDLSIFCLLSDAKMEKEIDLEQYPKLAALYEAVKNRERISKWLQANFPAAQ